MCHSQRLTDLSVLKLTVARSVLRNFTIQSIRPHRLPAYNYHTASAVYNQSSDIVSHRPVHFTTIHISCLEQHNLLLKKHKREGLFPLTLCTYMKCPLRWADIEHANRTNLNNRIRNPPNKSNFRNLGPYQTSTQPQRKEQHTQTSLGWPAPER